MILSLDSYDGERCVFTMNGVCIGINCKDRSSLWLYIVCSVKDHESCFIKMLSQQGVLCWVCFQRVPHLTSGLQTSMETRHLYISISSSDGIFSRLFAPSYIIFTSNVQVSNPMYSTCMYILPIRLVQLCLSLHWPFCCPLTTSRCSLQMAQTGGRISPQENENSRFSLGKMWQGL